MPAERLVSLARQTLSLVVGLVASFVAYRVGMPLPWMLGAMLGTTIGAMSGLPMTSPILLRPVVIPVIGVLLGSSLSVDVLRGLWAWLPSMLLLPVFLVTASSLCILIYRRIGGYDPVTAFFAAVPGGLNEMILFGLAYGGDERRIALAHGVRILLSVSFIGVFYGLVLGVSSTGAGRPWTALSALSRADFAWLGAAALVGGYIGIRFRIPAGTILLPMLLSASMHIAGVVAVPPPTVLVIGAQVVMGSTIGARFAGVRLGNIARDAALAVLTTSVMIACAFLFSELVQLLVATPRSQTFLAYAPGGLSEMSLIALAMGQDVAYVSVTHIVRILLVVTAAPLTFRALRKRRP